MVLSGIFKYMHSHSDGKIKTCKICQSNIKEIEKADKELNRLGVWNIPRNIKYLLKKGGKITIWNSIKN